MTQNNFTKAAFFDVDDTLITIKSMFDFFEFYSNKLNKNSMLNDFKDYFCKARKDMIPRGVLNRNYYKFFKNESLENLFELGKLWFNDCLSKENLFINETRDKLNWHKANSDKVIFVSGSMLPLLQPIADFLGVDDILCTRLCYNEEKILTGEIDSLQTIGLGKKLAIQKYAQKKNINLLESYAYGDDFSDLDMLLSVGNGVYVGNDSNMLEIVKKYNLEVISRGDK